jgi:nucleotide-binding universal stress UspA family protein
VACAIDLGDHSETVLRWASDFAQAYEAKLSVLHAVRAVDFDGADEEFFSPELRTMLIENAKEDVESLMEKVEAQGNAIVDTAFPERFVPGVVHDEHVDILVIGRSADRGLLGRLRTHAYALIRESPCPVISV